MKSTAGEARANRMGFVRDIGHSVGSSGVTLAVTLISAPVMTRLFSAEAYGSYGIVNTAATIIAAVGTFGLPIALARVRSAHEQARLVAASAHLAVFTSVLVTLAAVCAVYFAPTSIREIGVQATMMLPMLVLFNTTQKISDSLASAKGLFSALALARVSSAITTRGLTLLAGWTLSATATTMIVGDVLGRALHISITIRRGQLGKFFPSFRWRTAPGLLRATVREYWDFATYSNLATLLPMVATLAVQGIISSRYGVATAGQYVLALSILTLPVTLLAMASAPVIFHRLTQIADGSPHVLLTRTVQTLLVLFGTGVVCMLPVALRGPDLFAFAFGEPWRPAGEVAALLSFPQALVFSLTGLLALFRVVRSLRFWLILEAAGGGLLVVGYWLASGSHEFLPSMEQFRLLMLGYLLLMHAGCIFVAWRYTRGTR